MTDHFYYVFVHHSYIYSILHSDCYRVKAVLFFCVRVQFHHHGDSVPKSWVLPSCKCYGKNQRESLKATKSFTPHNQVRSSTVLEEQRLRGLIHIWQRALFIIKTQTGRREKWKRGKAVKSLDVVLVHHGSFIRVPCMYLWVTTGSDFGHVGLTRWRWIDFKRCIL